MKRGSSDDADSAGDRPGRPSEAGASRPREADAQDVRETAPTSGRVDETPARSRTGGSGGSTDVVAGDAFETTRPTTADAPGLTATLVGVPRVELGDYVYRYELDGVEPTETRYLALFDIENTGSAPLTWHAGRTAFIGDDGYTYDRSRLGLDRSTLGPGCHTRQVEVEPGRRARVVTLVEALPPGVELAEVVHTVRPGDQRSADRLTFSVS